MRVRAFFMFVRLCARGVGWKISIMVVGVDRCSNLTCCIGQHMGMGWAMREMVGKYKGVIGREMQFHVARAFNSFSFIYIFVFIQYTPSSKLQ